MSVVPGVNADQIDYWNSVVGERWATLQTRIDAVFAPLTDALLAFAAPLAGSSVIDIGCGAGATVLALADRVGTSGRVLGVDVSKPMLGVAARRVETSSLLQAGVLLADAATHDFGQGGFDLAFSRFGVMFFADPIAAFANIRTALVPEGRLAFACWQPLAANPLFAVPVDTLRALLPPAPAVDPLAPGPFAFADPNRVRRVLSSAGFQNIVIEPHETAMLLGDVEAALSFVAQIGPASRALGEADPARRPHLVDALRSKLANHQSDHGVTFGGAIWLVSAHAS